MTTPSRTAQGLHRRGILLAFTLVAIACGGSGDTAPPATDPATAAPTTTVLATTTTSTTVNTTSTTVPASTPADGPSQSATDAARDGVVQAVADLTFAQRVAIIDSVSMDEGVWAISRLAPAAEELADGCRLGASDGKYPTDFICTTEYGELLLLDTGRTRILRAFPLPGVPAEIITFSNDAIYCGRRGKLPMPDAMLCRVDRLTFEAAVMVFPPSLDSLIVQPCFFPPESWSVSDDPIDVAAIVVAPDGLFAKGGDNTWTSVDPNTLAIVATDVTPPPGHES